MLDAKKKYTLIQGNTMKELIQRIIKKLSISVAREIGNNRISIYDRLFEAAFQDSTDFVSQYTDNTIVLRYKEQMWEYVISLLKNNPAGNSLEFGVYRARSLNFFAKNLSNYDFFGFDSFEGLPENWYGTAHSKGSFDMNGVLPKVENNVELFKGWFEDTLPGFMDRNLEINFLHLDCDLYSATYYVLKITAPKLKPGTLILFDDFLGYMNWRNGQYKALQEISKELNMEYKFLAFSSEQALIEII
jgi:hypothetical protein